jgi:hypothetical protein
VTTATTAEILTTRQMVMQQQADEQARHEVVTAVVGVLEKHNGKSYSKRLIPALEAATGDALYFSDEYGLQHLISQAYHRNNANAGFRLLLGHGKGCPVIDIDRIREFNTCYLAAAEERNAIRAELLAGDWPEQVEAAATAAREALTTYQQLAGYSTCPDSYRIDKAHGLGDCRLNHRGEG